MRVSLWVDMEGAARIEDHRECWPPFPQYWESGRAKLTDDVVAAASGLLDGGATEVAVVNAHGLGWPNILWDRLPDGAFPAGDDWSVADAMFQVGFHSRYGTADGFVCHTMVPRLEVKVDGRPVTESHIWAWVMGVPLLGITGDAALELELDGGLQGTRFLAVKHSSSRSDTSPMFATREASIRAIQEFARECAQAEMPAPAPLPPPFEVTFSLDPNQAEQLVGQHGLVRKSAGVLALEAQDFAREAYPALEAAMEAAMAPFFEAQGDLDVTSEEALAAQDPVGLEHLRQFFTDWMSEEAGARSM